MLLTLWLLAWVGGGAFIVIEAARKVAETFSDHGPAAQTGPPLWQTALFLLGWTLGAVFATAQWLWMVVGREVIEVDAEGITRSWRPFRFVKPRRYLAAHIRGLREAPAAEHGRPDPWENLGMFSAGGVVAFHYGADLVRLGSQAPPTEGRQIVEAILSRFPSLGQKDQHGDTQDSQDSEGA